MVYATVSDLESRWRPLSLAEQERAGVLLEDAAVRLDAECAPSDPATPQELQVRLIVSVEMVKRSMISPGGIGINSLQQGAGPYQETVQYTNPTGDLYLTRADRKLLGCGGQVAFTVPMGGGSDCPPLVWLP